MGLLPEPPGPFGERFLIYPQEDKIQNISDVKFPTFARNYIFNQTSSNRKVMHHFKIFK